MDLPQPVTITNYNCLVKKTFNYSSRVMCTRNVGYCKTLDIFLMQNEDEIVNVAVTADKTWYKRYDHNSTCNICNFNRQW